MTRTKLPIMSASASALLAQERSVSEAPSGAQARVFARVEAWAAGAAGAPTLRLLEPPPAGGRGLTLAGARMTALLATLGTGVAGGVALDRYVLRPEPAIVPIPRTLGDLPTTQTAPVASHYISPPTPVVSQRKPHKKTEPAALAKAPSPLERERTLLDVAIAGLSRGDLTVAESALQRHEERFHTPVFAQEGDCLRIQLLAARGDVGTALERATRFGRMYPNSIFRVKIRETLSAADAGKKK